MTNFSKFFVSGIIMMVFVVPFLVQAETRLPIEAGPGQPAKEPIPIVNPFKQDTIKSLIEVIVKDILMPVGGVVAVVMIMWAGFLYVTAGGDPGQITKAHEALKWAVIGAAILLGAWVISTAIQGTISTLRR